MTEKTLRDWIPDEAISDLQGTVIARKFGYRVVEDVVGRRWPGKHKNVINWCVLENGYAVGWNENPARGWSFPIIKLKANA